MAEDDELLDDHPTPSDEAETESDDEPEEETAEVTPEQLHATFELILRQLAPQGIDEHVLRLADPECAMDEEFACEATGGVNVLDELINAVCETRALAEEDLPVSGSVCPTPPASCPLHLHPPHRAGWALHLVLNEGIDSEFLIRLVELAGLWGMDLSGEDHATRAERWKRKALHKNRRPQQNIFPSGVRAFDNSAPFADLSVVALRNGNSNREIHLHKPTPGVPREVYSLVDDDVWRLLPYEAGVGQYTLFKRTWWQASYHRQWAHEHVINWVVGLCAFYQSMTNLPLGVGDLSHIVGEEQVDHASHRLGIDVDLYVLNATNAAGGDFPEAYWVEGFNPLSFSRLRPPAAALSDTNRDVRYRQGTARRDGLDAAETTQVTDCYAAILAYCYLTNAQVDLVIWKGVRDIRARAREIARDAMNGPLEASWGMAHPWFPTSLDQCRFPSAQRDHSRGDGRETNDHADHAHIRLHRTEQTAGGPST